MCSIEIPTIKDAYGIFMLLRQIAEEFDEADFIVNLELRSRAHLAVYLAIAVVLKLEGIVARVKVALRDMDDTWSRDAGET